MKVVPFAFRNIGRNRDRAIVTLGAMALAGAIMIFYSSLMEGFTDTLERNMVRMSLGDIQIHQKGYRDDPDLYKRIEQPDKVLAGLADIGFPNAAPRLYGAGLAATELTSSGVVIRGVDIERESKVTQTHLHLLDGEWLNDSDPHGVVIGRKLARTLNVKIGNEIIIVSQAADGSMANDLYTVRGILKSIASGIDQAGFYMTEESFRELMAMPEGAHEIAIIRVDGAESVAVAKDKIKEVSKGLETKSWRELQPVIARLLDNADAGNIIMLLIVYAAIGMVTLNAMLMSVFERIREFGIMKAVGVTPWQIMLLVVAEAIIQALIACVLALVVALPLSYYFQTHGIDLSTLSHSASLGTVGGVAFDPVWYTRVTWSSVTQPLLFLLLIVGLAVIYPGVKAAVIKPVKAITYI